MNTFVSVTSINLPIVTSLQRVFLVVCISKSLYHFTVTIYKNPWAAVADINLSRDILLPWILFAVQYSHLRIEAVNSMQSHS